jgi:hypothetical protein
LGPDPLGTKTDNFIAGTAGSRKKHTAYFTNRLFRIKLTGNYDGPHFVELADPGKKIEITQNHPVGCARQALVFLSIPGLYIQHKTLCHFYQFRELTVIGGSVGINKSSKLMNLSGAANEGCHEWRLQAALTARNSEPPDKWQVGADYVQDIPYRKQARFWRS